MTDQTDRQRCPKCRRTTGDDWKQCGGACPMPMSPHHKPPQTDRQRAEAKAREIVSHVRHPETLKRESSEAFITAAFLETEQRARREGWEAGREEAAKAVDDGWSTAASIIRALPAPEDE